MSSTIWTAITDDHVSAKPTWREEYMDSETAAASVTRWSRANGINENASLTSAEELA